jgi:glycosyltransferase involved in cell wall biosynthesis
MRLLFALPGLHRVHRGAEVAFESVAQQIAAGGEHEVTLVGSGPEKPSRAYRYRRIPAVPRERFEHWPRVPPLRSELAWEELTFAAGLALRAFRSNADVTMTCGYPFTNWVLRTPVPGRRRPAHVFVTQNGDWPAFDRRYENRLFACEGLVCTNPLFYERNRDRWRCSLIPNGIDPARFCPGPADRASLGLPINRPVVLMASALIASKRVEAGIRAVARLPDAFLVVAGDGRLRHETDRLAADLLPGRYLRRTFPHDRMPEFYRAADVFLHAAIGESFGNVYVEALACGTPVVAHDDDLTRWIMEGHGRLVDATSEEALVEAIERALGSGAAERSARAAFAASRYAWSTVAAQYAGFFEETSAATSR